MDRWLLIVNPHSGRESGKRDFPVIFNMLKKHKISFDYVFTERKRHAIELAKEYIRKGYRNIISAGGDGTANEVVNGIFTQEVVPSTDILVAQIPVGTGNDWGRTVGIPRSYEQAIEVIAEGNEFVQDVGLATYFENGNQCSRYFINSAGLGFDSVVNERTNKLKDLGKGGKGVYFSSLLFSLISYKNKDGTFEIDNELSFNGRFFSACIGIGRYNGGGLNQLPKAEPADGLFDVTLIKKVTKAQVIANAKRLFNGTLLEYKKVVNGYKCTHASIIADPSIFLEADGETLGISPFTFKIIPKSLRVLIKK